MKYIVFVFTLNRPDSEFPDKRGPDKRGLTVLLKYIKINKEQFSIMQNADYEQCHEGSPLYFCWQSHS